MLNKPTNVSPYNEFIDATNGLDLNFTLNNTVGFLSVDIYKDDNSIVSGEVINNTDLKRDFSYTVPEDVLVNITNGNNYYWKTRYWKTPSEENKKESSYQLNYWNEETGILGLFPPIPIYYRDSNKAIPPNCPVTSCYWNNVDQTNFRATIQVSGLTAAIKPPSIRDGDYYIYFEGENISGYSKILGIEKLTGSLGINCSGTFFSIDGKIVDDINRLVGTQATLFNFTIEDINCSVGDYIQTPNGLYKINFINKQIYEDAIPSIGLSVSTSLFGLPTSQGNGTINSDISISIYGKAEYNESPPYYFSCRETPSISFYNVSISSPQVKIYANFEKYIEINSYFYQLYILNGNNDWRLMWESCKTSTLNLLEDGTYDTEIAIYNGINPMSTYKIKLVGQTMEGQDIIAETTFSSENFSPIDTKEFVLFNKDKGCMEIDNSIFVASTPTSELQIYRYDVLRDELNYVGGSTYDFNTITITDGLCKKTILYDFNIISGAEYIYYAYIIEGDTIISSYKNNSITPSWDGVYLVDVNYEDLNKYIPDLSSIWLVSLNNEQGDITRNYQISHPLGVNQKYPKSIRGNANFKTGKISGLLGNISCVTGDYEEGIFLINKFDTFCGNGNLKLLRSDTKGENMIVDIDTMSSSVFGQVATTINVGYTQIDDIDRKKISIEV